MNPFEHGEVFVTDDGGETDLDLGHYERFIDEDSPGTNATTGSIYQAVLAAERRASTWARPSRSSRTSPTRSSGGSRAWPSTAPTWSSPRSAAPVGDIEILPFLEAIRQFRLDVGRQNVCYVHVTLVPFIGPSGEQKTKPTQHSVTELRSRGIQPDAIVCRPGGHLPGPQAQDLDAVRRRSPVEHRGRQQPYDIPLVLRRRTRHGRLRILGLPDVEPDLTDWQQLVTSVNWATAPTASASSAST